MPQLDSSATSNTNKRLRTSNSPTSPENHSDPNDLRHPITPNIIHARAVTSLLKPNIPNNPNSPICVDYNPNNPLHPAPLPHSLVLGLPISLVQSCPSNPGLSHEEDKYCEYKSLITANDVVVAVGRKVCIYIYVYITLITLIIYIHSYDNPYDNSYVYSLIR